MATEHDVIRVNGDGDQELAPLEDGDIPATIARDSEVGGAVTTHAGAADPHADRSFATSAIATHAGLSDPHPGYLTPAEGNAAYDAIGAAAAVTTTSIGAVPTARTVSAGTGLTGGGDLSANRSLAADFGSAAGKVTQGNDSRLSDARTPTTHAASHKAGGSDDLSGVQNGFAPLSSGLLVPVAYLPVGTGSTQVAAGNHTHTGSINTDLLPAGALYHTFNRPDTAGNLGLLATGRLSIVMIKMDAGALLTSITFLSGTTALSVGVNQWFALFDSSRALLRTTVDDTSTAWAANVEKPLALSSTFTTTYSGIYFLGIMVKATTVPSLICATGNANVNAVVLPITGGNSTTGLTNPASCPNPAGAIAGGVGFPYAYVS